MHWTVWTMYDFAIRFFATLNFFSNTFPFIVSSPTPGSRLPSSHLQTENGKRRKCVFFTTFIIRCSFYYFSENAFTFIHLNKERERAKNNGNVCNRLTSDSSSSCLMLAQQINSYTILVSFRSWWYHIICVQAALHICVSYAPSIPWIRRKKIADGFKLYHQIHIHRWKQFFLLFHSIFYFNIFNPVSLTYFDISLWFMLSERERKKRRTPTHTKCKTVENGKYVSRFFDLRGNGYVTSTAFKC